MTTLLLVFSQQKLWQHQKVLAFADKLLMNMELQQVLAIALLQVGTSLTWAYLS